ncbi:hypothetical protein LJC32_01705 [Oscillospiraceae bacterium OttesenSCG-928-F05]|nr:hypothetical protein [Oscillospiraceae bacterium OttesenSCG-928-F05]
METIFRMLTLYNSSQKTDAYHKIIDVIFRNPGAFERMSIAELAEISYTSVPTIVRFAKALKHKSFSDFKYSFLFDMTAYPNTLWFDKDPTPSNYVAYNRRILDDIEATLNEMPFDALLEALHGASYVPFYMTFPFTGVLALQFALLHDGKRSVVFSSEPDYMEDVPTLDENALVVYTAIPSSRLQNNEEKILRNIKERGAKLFITSPAPPPLYTKMADYYGAFAPKAPIHTSSIISLTLFMNTFSMFYRYRYTDEGRIRG